MDKCIRFLLFFIAIVIPFEYKYDKPLRHLSLSLTPETLHLPKWFDKKIFFYPSDIAALCLLLLALFYFRKALISHGTLFLWAMLALIALSIALSPLAHYPIPYFRLWQLVTAIIFYAALAEKGQNLIRPIFLIFTAIGLLESCIAIMQYAYQWTPDLRLIGGLNHFSSRFHTPGGARWIFDAISNSAPAAVFRAIGTFTHTNVLAGYLCISSLIALHIFSEQRSKRWAAILILQLLALTLTYSRSGLFGFALGALAWALLARPLNWRPIALTLTCAFAAFGLLFQNQLLHRGGVLNSSPLSTASNDYRISRQTIAFHMIQSHPLTGIGYGQFSLRAKEYLPPNQTLEDHGAAHNIYLLLASEAGIPALLCFFAFIAQLLARARNSPVLAASLIALLFIGCCDFYPLLFQQGRHLLFLIAGLLISIKNVTRTSQRNGYVK